MIRLYWPHTSRRRPAAPLLLAVLAAVIAITSGRGAQEQQGAPAQTPPPTNKPAEYVTSSTCQGCHEDIFNAFQKNPHQVVETDKKRGWETKSCESCHGPGSKHAESMAAADIVQPAKLKPAETDKRCLTCHLNQPTHAGRINSSHARNQVSCTACHSIHKNGPHGLTERKPAAVNAQCASCHADVWASFQRPYKHRLPEGAMSCVDCHNPHGGTVARSMVRTVNANEPGCFKCHADKRGPFVFEHAPVKTQACSTCHEPHGSANPRMLTRAQVRFVCLECHANLPTPAAPANGTLGTMPPAIHDLRSPRFQQCTLCHQKVHGSYVNRDFLK
jgi:DmsE family decaheme c-type cytochrome